MKKVLVTSKNPVKINCTKMAFKKVFPDKNFEFVGISVASDVPEQPIAEQVLEGALNRVKNAKAAEEADFYVGIEGGLQKFEDTYEAFAWMVVEGGEGKFKDKLGKGRTGSFILPKKLSKLIDEGYELGEADDMVFKTNNSKQNQGSVGILTKGITNRTHYYVDAIVFALIPFINEDLY